MPEETELDIEEISSETEDNQIDTASYKINTYGADFTIQTLFQKIEDGEIFVPTWQRRYVWNQTKASKLIESFLLGLPVPQIFLYREEETQNLLVVDGQQRLKTISYFLKEKFDRDLPFYLKSVHQQWEGKKFSQLTEPDRKKLKNSILRATIFEQTNPEDNSSVFEIFERLNTGGMSLTPQEIRNCIVRGEINEFLSELNNLTSWRRLVGKDSPDTRMRDIEMILRFLALYHGWREYKKPMKDFLTKFMEENRNLGTEKKQHYRKIFSETMDLIYSEIGQHAFRRIAGLNIAIFDSISVALATLENRRTSNLKASYELLKKNEGYQDAIFKSTTDADRVASRIKIAIETFSK